MGIFSFRKKKSEDETDFIQMTVEEALDKFSNQKDFAKQTEQTESSKISNPKESVKPSNQKVSARSFDVLKQAEENCIQIVEIERKLVEAKREYEVVTAYLSDMQRIDQIAIEEREDIDDAARKIANLSKERLKFQKSNQKITEAQYHYMERFEHEMPREIERIKEEEKYQVLIKNDLKQLEGEKGVLTYEKESAMNKHDFVKQLSIVTCVLSCSVFILLILLNNSTEKDFTIPFFLTGVMALGMVFYIVVSSRNSVYRIKMAEKKLNRVIELTNKVKIKYVNTTNSLEYSYEKYRVNSYQELLFLWQEFVKAKDESDKYKKNTELLESYHKILIEELKKRGIVDAEVWTYQPEALLEKKEMVEVRHRLNNRRQKLREVIDSNNKECDLVKNSLLSLKRNYMEHNSTIDEMANGYHILC